MNKQPKNSAAQREAVAKGLCCRCGKRPIAQRSKSRCDECLDYAKLHQSEAPTRREQ